MSERRLRVSYGCYGNADIDEMDKFDVVEQSDIQKIDNDILTFEANGKRWWFNQFNFNGEHWTAEAQDGEKRCLTEVTDWHGGDTEGKLVGFIFGDVPVDIDYLASETVDEMTAKLEDAVCSRSVSVEKFLETGLLTVSWGRFEGCKSPFLEEMTEEGYHLDEFAKNWFITFDQIQDAPGYTRLAEVCNQVVPAIKVNIEVWEDDIAMSMEETLAGHETKLMAVKTDEDQNNVWVFSKDIVLKEDNVLKRWKEKQRITEITTVRENYFADSKKRDDGNGRN